MPRVKDTFEELVDALREACLAVYGPRLVALALFGSVARGAMRSDSDIDLLIVADPLPDGRMRRVAEFDAVEARMSESMRRAADVGVHTTLSPVFKTPGELRRGSPLFLDLTLEARILHDPAGVLRGYLDDLASRLRALGARRVPRGGGYYWLLKPDFRWGDRIEL